MKIAEGFDRQHRNFYFWFLVAMAFASGLMLIAGFFEESPRNLPKIVRITLAALSLLATTASYLSIDRFDRSYPLVGLSSVVYAASLWAFGLPTALVLLIAIPSLVLSLLCLIFKGAADLTDKVD